MKKIFSIIISVLFSFSLLFTLFLYVIRNNVTTDKVIDAISNSADLLAVDNTDTYLGNESTNIKRMSNDYNYDEIKSLVGDRNIDENMIKEIVGDDEFKDLINKYSSEITKYLTGKTDELNFDRDEINSKVNEILDKYEERTGERINRENLDSDISNFIGQVEDSVSLVRDVKPLTTMLNILLSDFIFYMLVGITFILGLIILLINMDLFVAFKYLSIPAIVVGSILLIGGLFVGIINISEFKDFTNAFGNDFKLTGVITMMVGVIMLVIYKVLRKDNLKEV